MQIFFNSYEHFLTGKGWFIHRPPPHFLQLKKDRETDFGKLTDNIQQFATCLLIF